MLRRSGTFMDTISSASNRAGIPSSDSATSNAWDNKRNVFNLFLLLTLVDFIWTLACSAPLTPGQKDVKNVFQRSDKIGELLSSDNDRLQLLSQMVGRFNGNLRLNVTVHEYLVFTVKYSADVSNTTKVSYCDRMLEVTFTKHVWTNHEPRCLGKMMMCLVYSFYTYS